MANRDFQTQFVRLGTGGLNQRPDADVVPAHQLTRMVNAVRLLTGGLTARPGQTAIATAGTVVHSITRMNKVSDNTFTRVWGIDTDLYYGATGALTLAEAGFSGNPLVMIPGDPPIPGDPWIYVADSTKMRKIRIDGLDFVIGLPPGVLISTVPQVVSLSTSIEPFDATDFNPFAGAGGGNPPTEALVASPTVGNALEFTTDPGGAGGSYTSFGDKAIGPLDLTVYSNGSAVQGSDFMHFWLNLSNPPSGTSFCSIYLVSGTFTSGFIPGVTPGKNDDYYVFQPNPAITGSWIEFGTATLPVTRDDFAGHGSPNWNNITGIVITMDETDAVVSTFAFDDFYLVPSLTPVTVTVPYDYRVTNYDPRTGVEGNPSPIQPQGSFLDNLQNVVLITPQAYGDAAIRQRAYRRGGTLPDNWYFVGENTSDGGVISDTNSDAAIAAAPTVQTDHDQPVTSQDSSGTTILAQPIPVIFGPVSGLYFGLGDPNQPSRLYWSLSDRPDYWPAIFQKQVTAPSEFLQNGCVWGGEGYVSTPLGWYRLIPNLSDSSDVNILPTGATKGQATRWAMIVGPDGVHYLGNDGWYRHTGGPQENLSDAEMWPLFNGVTKNGQAPIDYTATTKLRMGTTLTEVWLQYQNTDGAIQHLIRNVITGEWRIVQFVHETAVMVGEAIGAGQMVTLLGGNATGKGYTHTGTSDDGSAIPVSGRTAALDQGSRNTKRSPATSP